MSDSDDNPAYEDEFALGAEDEDDDKGGIISGGYVEEIEDSSSSSAPEKDTRIRRSRRSRVSVASTNPKYTEASSSDEDVQGEGKHSDIEEYNGEEEVERSESKNARGSSPRKNSSSLHSPATKEKEIPSRRSRRARVSAKSANPKYKGSVTSHDDDVEYDENISEDEDKVGQELEDEGVRKNTKRSSPRKRSSSSKSPAKKSAQSKTTPPKSLKLKAEDDIEMKYAEKDEKPSSKAINSRSNESIVPAENEGVDIVIPHSLLNNSRQSRKECNVLVQVEPNDEEASMHLDFIGQSGAIGRFEADENGVILDLKGYQYRGTIRPGPTAMVVALTRDGKLKVESITDEFVTLDTNTRTDVMAKLDAVVEGDMDDGYVVRDDNVNDNKRGGDNSNKGKKGSMADSDQNDDGKGKMRKKRVSAPKSSGGGAAKKKRVSSMKKK